MIPVKVLSSLRPLAVIRLKNGHRLEIVDKDVLQSLLTAE